ncbi:MAG: pyridoxamine 5'-phosphate oxidase family protein, partial [Candidatus Dormibacteria bacterium]
MSAELNERDREIVHGKNFAHLSTLRRDGAPISTVLWVDEDQGTLVMNTAMDRVKVVNINHDPRVAVSIHRQENPQQSLALVGTASLETDHAEEVI